jgi:hypothetical protein
MSIRLIIVRSFAGFARGEIVADPVRISQILKSENAHCVVRVSSNTPEK